MSKRKGLDLATVNSGTTQFWIIVMNFVEIFIQIAHFVENICQLIKVHKSCTFRVLFNCRETRDLSVCAYDVVDDGHL